MRGSTTDPECRKMKMADGSVRCAYNVQIAVENNSEMVVKTLFNKSSSDTGTMLPMFKELENTYKQSPEVYVVDAAYIKISDLNSLFENGCHVYSPTSKSTGLSLKKKVFSKKKGVSEGEKEFVNRMETEEAKAIYNQRIRTSTVLNILF